MSKRKGIGKRLRFEIFKRDEFTCQYCGAHPPKAILHVDHITPVAEGGGNEPENLITSCDGCNLGKSDIPLDVIPQPLAERAAEIEEREEQIRGFAAVMAARRERIEVEAWEVAGVLTSVFGGDGSIRRDWFQGIKLFVERLGVHEVVDAMEIAVGRKSSSHSAFKYFCGICWNRIREGEVQ